MNARRAFQFVLILSIFVLLTGGSASGEALLKLPDGLRVVEEEAFYGAKAIREVVLPEGVQEIRAKAFARFADLH